MTVEVPADRVPNWPLGGPRCLHCDDDGQLVVLLRKPDPTFISGGKLIEPNVTERFEEMAPCPHCTKGFRVEFGIGVKKNTRDEIIDAWHPSPSGGPWGRDGYWKGRIHVT